MSVSQPLEWVYWERRCLAMILSRNSFLPSGVFAGARVVGITDRRSSRYSSDVITQSPTLASSTAFEMEGGITTHENETITQRRTCDFIANQPHPSRKDACQLIKQEAWSESKNIKTQKTFINMFRIPHDRTMGLRATLPRNTKEVYTNEKRGSHEIATSSLQRHRYTVTCKVP